MQQIFRERIVNVPNILTMVRIALLPLVAWRFKMGDMISALTVYLIAMLTDVFDGMIARRTNQITTLGKLLDPLADKLSLITLLALFVGIGQIAAWVLVAIIVKETIMVIGSCAAMKNGVFVSAMPIGKMTTASFVVSFAVRFLGWTYPADMLMYASLILSLAALLHYSLNVINEITKRAKAGAIE